MCNIRGGDGSNKDLMLTTRREPKRDEITGQALLHVQKFIESLSYIPLSEENIKRHGLCNKKNIKIIDEPTHISVKDLITVYKWVPRLCNMATFLPIFTEVIDNDKVKIEDVPKFDSLMYRVMGE